MKKLAFKWVRKEDDGKFSSYAIATNARVFYEVLKIAKPLRGRGPLACFDSLKNALNFVREDYCRTCFSEIPWEKISLFLCEIVPSSEVYLWENIDTQIDGGFSIAGIPGAITAWSVTLLCEIPYQKHFEEMNELTQKYR